MNFHLTALCTVSAQFLAIGLTFLGCASWALWLARGLRFVSATAVFLTGLAGFIAFICLLQNLVYCDLRLGVSSWLGLVVPLSGLMFLPARIRALRHSLGRRERAALTGASTAVAVVLAIQCIPLVVTGPQNYTGMGRIDQANYVQIAQYLMERPIHDTPATIEGAPWLKVPLQMRRLRIGQCVILGYVATVTTTDAKSAYGLVNVAFIGLAAAAVLFLTKSAGLSPRVAFVASLWFGVLPVTTAMYLDGYMSQTLTVFALPCLALAAVPRTDNYWPSVVTCALVLGFVVITYSEILPLAVALVGAVSLCNSNLTLARRLMFVGLTLAGSLCLVPAYSLDLLDFVRQQYAAVDSHPELRQLAVNAGTWQFWTELFILKPGGFAFPASILCGMALVGAGVIAFASSSPAARLRLLAIAAVPLASLALLCAHREIPLYPLGKLTATYSPFWVLLIAVGAARTWRGFALIDFSRFFRTPVAATRNTLRGALLVFTLGLACGTAVATTRLFEVVLSAGGQQALYRTAGMQAVLRQLQQHPEQVYVVNEPVPTLLRWLAYEARRSRVYIAPAENRQDTYDPYPPTSLTPAGLASYNEISAQGVLTVP